MPWLSIIMFIVSFFLSKKSGATNAQAALTGAAVGGLTYLAVDPANPTNWFGITAETPVLGSLAPAQVAPSGTGNTIGVTAPAVGSTTPIGTTLGNLISSPLGAGLTGATVGASLAGAPWLIPALCCLGAYLVLK